MIAALPAGTTERYRLVTHTSATRPMLGVQSREPNLSMRRLLAAALSLTSLAARPSAAQEDVITRYSGCNLYFCTFIERRDFVLVPDYDYRFSADIFFTLRAPIVEAAPDLVLGTISLPDNEYNDYAGGIEFNFDARGHQVGDVISRNTLGGGRTPAGPFGFVRADLFGGVTLPDGPFNDHVENQLFDTTTPEPATLALVGGGLVLVGVAVRRRRADA